MTGMNDIRGVILMNGNTMNGNPLNDIELNDVCGGQSADEQNIIKVTHDHESVVYPSP